MRDPSMEHAPNGLSNLNGLDENVKLTTGEKEVLRTLAHQAAELAARPVEIEKQRLWQKHNDLDPNTRPLFFCDPENGWNEIILQHQLKCTTPLFRVWEMKLRKEIFWAEAMQDDRVIEPYFNVPYHFQNTGYGVLEQTVRTEEDGSCIWINPIKDYAADFTRLKFPQIIVDHPRTNRIKALAEELLGDILKVRIKAEWWWTLGMTWDFIILRGLSNLMLDLIDQPTEVHRLMDFLCQAVHQKLDFLEQHHLLHLNTGGTYIGSGGFGWTTQLPQPDFNPNQVRLMDMWGFAESQETLGIAPEMFAEFIFPYQKSILNRFGLNCYGCCEPLDHRWSIIQQIPRLRRVSVSAWASVEKMAEYLGNRYIFSYKPSPSELAVPQMNEARVRSQIRNTLQSARGCRLEIIMKDNHTLGHNPANAVNWCRIVREEIGKL